MSETTCEEMVIEPGRRRSEKLLPGAGCLLVNPQDAAVACDQLLRDGGTRRFLFNSTLIVSRDETFFVAGPAMGAPMAVMTLEKLIALGAQRIVLFGWCGSLVPELAIGDCLVADQGLCGEGTSAYYSKDPEPKPSADLCGRLQRILDRAQMSWHKGRIWSTDAPYREARSLLREVHERHGIVAVDMEYTALCTVAAFRGVKLAALFVISDEIWRKQWTAGFTRSDFKLQLRQTITELLAAMAAGNFSEQSSGGQDNA